MDFEYSKTIRSDLKDIDDAVTNVLNKLSEVIKDEELMFDVRLVINEIVINSYEHGNKCDIQKGIHLRVCVNLDCIEINVQDEGDGINYIFNEDGNINMTTSGRGLSIVSKLVHSLEIDKNRVNAILKK